MTKAVISLGYKDYVLDAEDALAILKLLANAELFKEKWASKDDGGSSYYVYPQGADEAKLNLHLITDDLYRMAKLAGRPE